MQPYRHEPFDDPGNQIRVLSLLPAPNFEDDLHCNLQILHVPQNTDADSILDYEAVSYAWGDNALTNEALINNCRLAITANLDTALRYLRHADRVRSLWIDGICIDQSNDEEKSFQVQMLRRTFSRATEVLIWLGPADKDTNYVMQCFNDLHDLRGRGVALKNVFYLPDVQIEILIKGLEKLFARAWWSRVWTMVELLFAKRSHVFGCGKSWTTGLEHAPYSPFNIFSLATTSLGERQPQQLDSLLR